MTLRFMMEEFVHIPEAYNQRGTRYACHVQCFTDKIDIRLEVFHDVEVAIFEPDSRSYEKFKVRVATDHGGY